MPTVVVNGQTRTLPDGASVRDAVIAAGAPGDGRGVAVALDGEVLPRSAWELTRLTDASHLEVLRAVQGG